MGDHVGQRAVVLGGSVAGLMAARVLADAYREVVVVDRDQLTGVTGTRRAVPQGQHIHALLARGGQIVEELLPGFTKELTEMGIPLGDFGDNLRWYFNGRMMQKVHLGLVCISAGRTVIEDHIRKRVSAFTNIRIVEQTDIVDLAASADKSRITGVRVVRRANQDVTEVIEADLIVDATGRGSRAATWLAALGYPEVEEERVKMDLYYTTRNYRMPMPTDPFGEDVAIIPVATPENPRGAIFARFADRYAVSLTGILGDRPPTDPDGFLDYVKSLAIPDVYDAIRDAEPLDDAVSYHFPASIRRRYEKMSRFPAGLLLIGDALASFNPVYGQGMTVALQETLVLQQHLQSGRPLQPRQYLLDVSKVIDGPWDMSAGADLGFPGVEGKRNDKFFLGNAFIPKLQAAAEHDSVLTGAFLRTAGLVDPLTALMTQDVVMRVFKNGPTKGSATA